MSVSPEFFIGWYVKAKYRYSKGTGKEKVCYSNPDHEIDVSANYCGVCGTKIISRDDITPRTLNIYDIPEQSGDLQDRFYEPEGVAKKGEVILVSNWSAGHYNGEFINSQIMNMDSLTQANQYTEFIKEHDQDISLLKEYVYDNVQLFYGAFVYYS